MTGDHRRSVGDRRRSVTVTEPGGREIGDRGDLERSGGVDRGQSVSMNPRIHNTAMKMGVTRRSCRPFRAPLGWGAMRSFGETSK